MRSNKISEEFFLHFFSDASKYGYVAGFFIRMETSKSNKVQLLQARSKVYPTGKNVTMILRLESLAATVSIGLFSFEAF